MSGSPLGIVLGPASLLMDWEGDMAKLWRGECSHGTARALGEYGGEHRVQTCLPVHVCRELFLEEISSS